VASAIVEHRDTDGEDDAYRWLEPAHDPSALEWAAEKTAEAKASLGGAHLYPQLRAELNAALEASGPTPTLFMIGHRSCRLLQDLQHPHGLFQVLEGAQWRALLDVDALRKAEGVSYTLRALLIPKMWLPGTDLCLLPLSIGGGDEMELREFDLGAAAFVEDGFRIPVSQALAVMLDADQVLITHTLGDAPRAASGRGAAVFLWTRGQRIEEARRLLSIAPTESMVTLDAVGFGDSRMGLVTRIHDYATFSFALVDRLGVVNEAPLPRHLKPFPPFATTSTHFLVQLAHEEQLDDRAFAAESLIAYDTRPGVADAQRASLVHEFHDEEFANNILFGFGGTRDQFHFTVDRRTRQRLLSARWQDGGWRVEERLVAEPGVTLRLAAMDAGSDKGGEAFLLSRSGYLSPNRCDLMGDADGAEPIDIDPPAFTGDYRVSVFSAVSRDGVEVDYYLLEPRDRQGPVPTLMTGYGAFGASFAPGYFDLTVGGRSLKLWLDRGGALALPLIRGGGERGAAWHDAAVREKRQTSYDDFIAVAEALIVDGVTTPAQLGVFGSSNGGLLAGVVGVQRPDLFGAVVIDAPVLDMLRYHRFGIGGGLMTEYGDPDEPVTRKAILGYSPYQNLRPGRAYPAFLVTVSTEDNRVGPMHARKFVARASEVGARALLIEEPEGGHGMSDPVTNPELMAMRMTFLIDALMAPSRAPAIVQEGARAPTSE